MLSQVLFHLFITQISLPGKAVAFYSSPSSVVHVCQVVRVRTCHAVHYVHGMMAVLCPSPFWSMPFISVISSNERLKCEWIYTLYSQMVVRLELHVHGTNHRMPCLPNMAKNGFVNSSHVYIREIHVVMEFTVLTFISSLQSFVCKTWSRFSLDSLVITIKKIDLHIAFFVHHGYWE